MRKSALYGKAHSRRGPSRKSALWARALTEKRTLGAGSHGKAHSAQPPELQNAHFGEAHMQNAPFREGDTPRVRLYVSRRLQSGAFVYTPDCPHVSPQQHNSVHKRPKKAPRGSFPPICVHSCVPTVARTILASRNSVHKCPKVAPRGSFPPICVHSCVVALAVRPTSPGR